MTFYPDNIVDADLTYDQTEDTNYPIENLNNTNPNILFKDSSVAGNTCNIEIQFDTNLTATYVKFGGLIATASTGITVKIEGWDDLGSAWESKYNSTYQPFISFSNTDSYGLYRITFTGYSTLTAIEIATLFFGESPTLLTTSPERETFENGGYRTNLNEGAGGARFAQIANTTARRSWQYSLKYVTAAEKTNLETIRDTIFMSTEFSLYPMWFSPDDGTTFYYARTIDLLNFSQIAYQRYETPLNFSEEI